MIRIEETHSDRIRVFRDGEQVWESESYEVIVDIVKFVRLFTDDEIEFVEIEEGE